MNGEDLVFAPYWRFKGVVYAVSEEQVVHRVVDQTMRASNWSALPYTLGVRPQTLKLRMATAHPPNRVFASCLDRKQFLKQLRAGHGGDADGAVNPISYQSAVGEVISLLHAPYLLRGGTLHDPYSGRALHGDPADDPRTALQEPAGSSEVRFLPTLCPDCGWDLQGTADSHVLFCRSCQSIWEAVGRGFHRMDPQFLPQAGSADTWLPFWCIDFETTGFELATYKDFVRLTNVPRVLAPAMASKPFHFWVPAFKIQPRLFLRLSGLLTLAQPESEPMALPAIGSLYPCTLPAVAGFQSVPVVLGSIAPAKRDLLPRIRNGRFAFQGKRLVWVPFQTKGVECIQPSLGCSIPRESLRWGRSL